MEISDPQEGAHLNAVLCISDPLTTYELLYNTIAEAFQPDEVSQMLYNIATDEVDFPDTPLLSSETNEVLSTYFQKDEEMIVLSWHEGNATLQHSSVVGGGQLTGQHIIAKLLNDSPDIELLIGFELEISVHRLEDSIIQNISDRSLWPIIIVKKQNGQMRVDKRFEEGSGGEALLAALENYLSEISDAL